MAKGGAVFFGGVGVSLSGCCFVQCVAPEHGQALYVQVQNLNSDELAVRECSMERPCGEAHALCGIEGNQHYRTSNISHNIVAEGGACAGSFNAAQFSFYYAMISYNLGNNLFWVVGVGDARVTHCSVLHNRAVHTDGFFWLKGSLMRLEQCNFIENKFTKFAVNGRLRLDGKIVIDFDMAKKLFDNVDTTNLELAFKVIWIDAGMKVIDTWVCWALGKPSASPSQSQPPLDGGDTGESGIATFLILSFVAGIPTILGYFWWTNNGGKARDLSVLENVEISNT
jgi:hypothetical protein